MAIILYLSPSAAFPTALPATPSPAISAPPNPTVAPATPLPTVLAASATPLPTVLAASATPLPTVLAAPSVHFAASEIESPISSQKLSVST